MQPIVFFIQSVNRALSLLPQTCKIFLEGQGQVYGWMKTNYEREDSRAWSEQVICSRISDLKNLLKIFTHIDNVYQVLLKERMGNVMVNSI